MYTPCPLKAACTVRENIAKGGAARAVDQAKSNATGAIKNGQHSTGVWAFLHRHSWRLRSYRSLQHFVRLTAGRKRHCSHVYVRGVCSPTHCVGHVAGVVVGVPGPLFALSCANERATLSVAHASLTRSNYGPDVCFWHFSTVPNYQANVCCWGYNGRNADITNLPRMTQIGHAPLGNFAAQLDP
jgi:hypothetical protein